MTKGLLPHVISLVFFVAQNCITSEGNPMGTLMPHPRVVQSVHNSTHLTQDMYTSSKVTSTATNTVQTPTSPYNYIPATQQHQQQLIKSRIVREATLVPSLSSEHNYFDESQYVNDDPNPTFNINEEPSDSDSIRNLTEFEKRRIRKEDRSRVYEYYRQYPVIQIHNKHFGRNIDISRKGEISLNAKSTLSTFFREHRENNLTVLTSLAHCYKLCIDKSGHIYTQDHGSVDPACSFDKSLGYRDITQYIKLISSVNSNDSHNMYLYPSNRRKLVGRSFKESEVDYSEELDPKNSREWVFLRVNETDVVKHKQTFRKKAGGNRDDRNKDGHLHYVLHREAWHSYCYSVVEQRRRAEKKQEARVKKYCENQGIEDEKVCQEEFACVQQRRQNKESSSSKSAVCTQAERDKKFGRGWKWNTRNCSSLPKSAKKECRKEKRQRCVQQKMDDEKMPRKLARQLCKKRKLADGVEPKKANFYSKCLRKHSSSMSRENAKKLCRKNKRRHEKRHVLKH